MIVVSKIDLLAKKTMKRSMTNWVIWRVVRYFFHLYCQLVSIRFGSFVAYPDSGTTSGSIVVVV
jgi:type II secretory pathway component PulL